MDSHLDSTSSTQSPPASSTLPPTIATRLPPELLLDIFSIVSNSPQLDYEDYLERNRNLKSAALVHSSWRGPAQEILQEEVYIRGPEGDWASDEELERISSLLMKSKVGGTKYLTINGHLDGLIAATGYTMWRSVRYLQLWMSSRNDRTTSMSDFVHFPRLEELHLDQYCETENVLCFAQSDVDLRFPLLSRLTIGSEISVGRWSESGDVDRAESRDVEALCPIAFKLFSPSNMPNLRHLALYSYGHNMKALLAQVLPQLTTLAISGDYWDRASVDPKIGVFANLDHLYLETRSSDLSGLSSSLHLPHRTIEEEEAKEEEEEISRMIGKDPEDPNKRIAIYRKMKQMQAEYPGYGIGTFKCVEHRGRSALSIRTVNNI